MARRKKKKSPKSYRNIQDRNFLEMRMMPSKASRAEVIAWMKESPITTYIHGLAMCHKAVRSYKEKETDRFVYVGTSYGNNEKAFSSEWARTGWGRKVNEALLNDGIDLMPPLYHTLPGKEFSFFESEVVQWLIGKNHIYELVYLAACYNKVITFNTETGCFQGELYQPEI
ncbi:hypothetical protein [Enterococcus faecalis]|uniref:hypothetical protein n=1 Tax=Enterococcus faecalis TaxID=1351 RepID=UPI003397A2A1